MVWVIIERFVHLMTLFLLILMVSIIFSNNKSDGEISSFNLQLEEFRQDVARVRAKNIEYLENRINKLGETQDNYQNTSASKMSVLEQKVLKLETEEKKNNKIINVNTNTQYNTPSSVAAQ